MTEHGYSVVAYFPPEVPLNIVDDFIDYVADAAYDIERDEWDPFVYGNAGDISGRLDDPCYGDLRAPAHTIIGRKLEYSFKRALPGASADQIEGAIARFLNSFDARSVT